MKSLARLLISHVFISIFVTFFLLSGHIEQGTEIPENPIKKNTSSKRISLFYPRILSTTFNKSYGLEIPGISNNLYHF